MEVIFAVSFSFFVYVYINLVFICTCSLKHVIASFIFIIEAAEFAIDPLGLTVFYGFCPFNKFNVFFPVQHCSCGKCRG